MPDLFHRLKLAAHPTSIEEGESAETKLHCTYARTKEIMVLAETQLFVYVLVQVKLLDDGDFKNVSHRTHLQRFRPKSSATSFTWD
jgi:hypothetical protein